MNNSKPPDEDRRLTSEDLAEFKAMVLAENLRRFVPLLLLAIAMNVFILVVELKTPEMVDLTSRTRLILQLDPITLIRLSLLAMAIVYFILIGKPGKRSYFFQRTVFLGMVGLGMTLIAVLSGNVLASQGNTFFYIIAILLLSFLLVLSFKEMLGVIAPSILCMGYAIAKVLRGELGVSLVANIVNIIAVTAFAILAAHLSYQARKQRFTYERIIQRQNEYLKTLSELDGLTGVANRRKVGEIMATIQAFAVRDRISVAALMIDLDDFKGFNDTNGHLAGDELLKKIAATMQGELHRNSDLFGRYGGEEFIAFLPSTDADGARRIGEKLRQAVMHLAVPYPKNPEGVVTVSVGWAAGIPTREIGIQEIVRRADEALFRAKHSGKNRVEG
jgi:diguanylate cyclase (GGDEF)-like protein